MGVAERRREIAAARRERAKPLRMYPRDVPVGVILIVKVYGGGKEEVELVGNEIVGGQRKITVRSANGERSHWTQNAAAKLDVKKGTLPRPPKET